MRDLTTRARTKNRARTRLAVNVVLAQGAAVAQKLAPVPIVGIEGVVMQKALHTTYVSCSAPGCAARLERLGRV